jgi:Predicted nucleoside-diphosphate-sugar epimerase
MPHPKQSALPWTITDGRAGNVRQAVALASALRLGGVRRLQLEPRAPWRWAAPRQLPGMDDGYGPAFSNLLQMPPALAIGCGRQAAAALRRLRPRGTRTVQILDPRIDPRHWDLVVVPEHDRLRGANVLTLLGSLNPVDDNWLAAGRAAFAAFEALPAPRTALLVGGPTEHAPWTAAASCRCSSSWPRRSAPTAAASWPPPRGARRRRSAAPCCAPSTTCQE